MKEIIKATNLTKIFCSGESAVRAVDNVDLVINEGETVGLVGESGSGKSTLGRLILNLIEPTKGKVLIEGQPIEKIARKILRQKVQIIFQDPYSSLNPRIKVFDAIYEPLYIHDIHGKKAEEGGGGRQKGKRVYELLDLVKLPRSFDQRYPHELSGGERQRVVIARALALNPSFIVCDEPVSSLDVSIQDEILKLLKDIQRQLSLTYLFISHDLAVVYNFCDRVVVMHDGCLVEENSPKQIFEAPQQEYTKKLISAIPQKLYKILA